MGVLVKRWTYILLGLLVPLGAGLAADRRVPARTVTEYEVKAACLVNLVDFVRWPAGGPLAVAAVKTTDIDVVGNDPFGPFLEKMAATRGKQRGIALHVEHIAKWEQAAEHLDTEENTHVIVFIAASEKAHVEAILAATAGHSVLTVGETPDFCRQGGMINLTMKNNRIRFEINPTAATQAGLKISSKLLKLATIVESDAEAVQKKGSVKRR